MTNIDLWEEIRVECVDCGKIVVDQRVSLLDDDWRWKEDEDTREVKKAMCSGCYEEDKTMVELRG